MWIICEKIFLGLCLIVCLLALISCFLYLIKQIAIYPFSRYYLNKRTNKIQWKAVETDATKMLRLRPPPTPTSFEPIVLNEYNLQYRILPSELPFFIRVFSKNEWQDFNKSTPSTFKQESDFIRFVSQFKTYGDVLEYNRKFDIKITWIHP